MSDTPTPRMNDAKELSRIYSVTVQADECIYNEGCKLERELAEAHETIDSMNRLDGASISLIRRLRDAGAVLQDQLTAHKAALEKCEEALSQAWKFHYRHMNEAQPATYYVIQQALAAIKQLKQK